MSRDNDALEAHVVVRGHVQRVYFRGSLQQQAETRGVTGWTRNREDGAVEAVLQGPKSAVERVVEWMRAGPRGARVDSAEVEWSEPREALRGFEIVG